MNYMSLQLKDSLNQLKGKGANHITHYLKNLGGKNGSMISGIEKSIDTINKENRELIIKGVVAGSVIILISNVTTWLYMKCKARKENELKTNKIIVVYKKEVCRKDIPLFDREATRNILCK